MIRTSLDNVELYGPYHMACISRPRQVNTIELVVNRRCRRLLGFLERLKYRESPSILAAMGLEPGTLEIRDRGANCNTTPEGLLTC